MKTKPHTITEEIEFKKYPPLTVTDRTPLDYTLSPTTMKTTKNDSTMHKDKPDTCLACGKPEHEWGPNCEGIIPKSSRPKLTTTKNDSTAEILKEFDEKADSFYIEPDETDPIKNFIAQALTRQREEIVRSLRMEHTNDVLWDTPGEVYAYNKAVNEFNEKLDKLK